LKRELGQGAFARVFLAEQADLDHRLVVLKVSTKSTAEPQLLARASHPHIVEVLRHATTDDGRLHLICMPFLGGATLASVLEIRRKLGRKPRSGLDLLADLDQVSAPEYPSTELVRPAREVIARLNHAQGLAWIVARLAEALDHAYGRGVAHGDLKPSNVLITAEGVPLLLDMNLSTDWRGAGGEADPDGPAADLGGTLAYMAPERLSAIVGGGEASPPSAADRHRADLYALGLMLLEALTGEAPEVPHPRPKNSRALASALASLRQTLPGSLEGRGDGSIPTALRAILANCLAPDPQRRYTRGNELAEDLDLWRSDRRLQFAREPWPSALARMARRRRIPLIGLGLTLAAASIVGAIAQARLTGTKQEQAKARYAMILDQPESGAYAYRRLYQWVEDATDDPAEVSARKLARYEALANPDWRDRDDFRSLPELERAELEAWLLEQTLRHAVALRLRSDSRESWQRGLELLDRTLSRSESASLRAERSTLLALLGRSDPGPSPSKAPLIPRWMEEYLAGVAAEPDRAREALDHYLAVLRDRPHLFWAHYRASTVAVRIGEFTVAAEQLRPLIARSPANPSLRLLLGSALWYAERDASRTETARPFAAALAECDRAVELAPDYARAYQVRAQIRRVAGMEKAAADDVTRHRLLMARGGPGSALSLGFNLNFGPGVNSTTPDESLLKLGRKVLENDPRDHMARINLAVLGDLAKRPRFEAIAELDRVIESDPGHLLARFERARLIYGSNPADALPEFRELTDHPRFEELFAEQPRAIRAFHYLATEHLKRGELADAFRLARASLAHVERSPMLNDKATHVSLRPGVPGSFSAKGETYYLLARIYAAEAEQDPGRVDQVVDCLEQAFAIDPSFRGVWFATDPRFNGLRGDLEGRLTEGLTDR
jgi:serine/threonine protein kinase